MFRECPVCYEIPEKKCDFLCGHSFCYQCVKTWYQKGTETCPMCRTPMRFHGMLGYKKGWDSEMREKVLESFVEYLLEDLANSEYLLDVLNFVHSRYNTLIKICPDIDPDLLGVILRNPYFKLNVKRIRIHDDIPTYMNYLLVPKTAYGVFVKCK